MLQLLSAPIAVPVILPELVHVLHGLGLNQVLCQVLQPQQMMLRASQLNGVLLQLGSGLHRLTEAENIIGTKLINIVR